MRRMGAYERPTPRCASMIQVGIVNRSVAIGLLSAHALGICMPNNTGDRAYGVTWRRHVQKRTRACSESGDETLFKGRISAAKQK